MVVGVRPPGLVGAAPEAPRIEATAVLPLSVPRLISDLECLHLWQTNPYVTPLTCGAGHGVLVPEQDGCRLLLRCPDCSYTRDGTSWMDEMEAGSR